jgi:hypothetical protein
MKYVENYLEIGDCEEIVRRKNFKKQGSMWWFFWGAMEEETYTANECAKKCKHLEKDLIKLAEQILKARDKFEKKGKPLIKELLKHTYKY